MAHDAHTGRGTHLAWKNAGAGEISSPVYHGRGATSSGAERARLSRIPQHISWHNEAVDLLTREQIERAFERLNAILAGEGVHAELYLVGGAVMCLALNARPATKDVDGGPVGSSGPVLGWDPKLGVRGGRFTRRPEGAKPLVTDGWFTEPPAVRAAARKVALELSLPEDWLNDAAKAFVPPGGGFERWRSLSHLDISVADDRTLLAMKCAAARSAEDAHDIQFIAARLGLTRPIDVLEVVLAYFPADRLPVRTQLLIEELFG